MAQVRVCIPLQCDYFKFSPPSRVCMRTIPFRGAFAMLEWHQHCTLDPSCQTIAIICKGEWHSGVFHNWHAQRQTHTHTHTNQITFNHMNG